MYEFLENKIVYKVGGIEKGVLEFRVVGRQADIYHTYVDDDLRGQGIASKLVEMAFDYFEKMVMKLGVHALMQKIGR